MTTQRDIPVIRTDRSGAGARKGSINQHQLLT